MAKLDFQYVIISFSVCHMILGKYYNMLIWSLIMINYCNLLIPVLFINSFCGLIFLWKP